MTWEAILDFTDPLGSLYVVMRLSVVLGAGSDALHASASAHFSDDPEIVSAACEYSDPDQDCLTAERDVGFVRARLQAYLRTEPGRRWLHEQGLEAMASADRGVVGP